MYFYLRLLNADIITAAKMLQKKIATTVPISHTISLAFAQFALLSDVFPPNAHTKSITILMIGSIIIINVTIQSKIETTD